MSTIFPSNPQINDIYDGYIYTGTAWEIIGIDLNADYLTISNAASTYQAKVSGVSDTEIGYLDGVTSGIQSQIDSKLSTSSASTTYLPLSAATANQLVYKNSSNVATGSSGLTYDGTSIKVNGNLESVYHNGDEGGEIFLHNADTNTTLSSGVTIDIFRDKLRIFEQGGNSRGVYIDISSMPNGVGRDLAPPKIAFAAMKNDDGNSVSGDYVFDDILVNTGNAYSNTTGKFTAPVAGNYFFTTAIQIYGVADTTNSTVYFRKNGSQYPSVDSSNGVQSIINKVSTTYHNTHNLSSVIPLAVGDTINVYTTAARGMQSHFSGYFLG